MHPNPRRSAATPSGHPKIKRRDWVAGIRYCTLPVASCGQPGIVGAYPQRHYGWGGLANALRQQHPFASSVEIAQQLVELSIHGTAPPQKMACG